MTTPSLDKEQAEAVLVDIVGEGDVEKRLPIFFLHSLQVENFRAIEDATFTFQPGLNVIIGANNAAKSAVVDALRLVFSLGSFEHKEDFIKLRPTDVYMNDEEPSPTRSISFTATFYGKANSEVKGQFLPMLCPDEPVELGEPPENYLVFRLVYRADYAYSVAKSRYEYVRNEVKGGPSLTTSVDHDVLDSMRSIYLAPLRDLVDDRARVGAEIERLLLSHTPKGKEAERAAIPRMLREKADELIREITGNKHQDAAGENLSQYARPYGIPKDSLSFLPAGISESLFGTMWPIFAHGLHGVDGLPLSSNGLGLNQLIYASIVLSRRGAGEVDDHVHNFFLIEEPEAHLHPQLQDSFFHALNKITDHQLFVTSHSPTITAKTAIEKIIVMRRDSSGRVATPLHLAAAFEGREEDKRYLHKFLDVTRSQLLFAKGAIFVEGITEAMLMQSMSEIVGRSLRDAAVEIVVVDSDEGYEHFRPLFDNGDDAYCRAVFITDGDEDPKDVLSDSVFLAGTDSRLDRFEVENNTAIATGYGTFEFGLVRTAALSAGIGSMQALLTEAMKKSAPPSVKNAGKEAEFARDFLDFDKPSLAYKKMKTKRKESGYVTDTEWYGSWRTNTYFKDAKSNFAFYLQQELAELGSAAANDAFVVPQYIKKAIEYVVADPEAQEQEPASGTDT